MTCACRRHRRAKRGGRGRDEAPPPSSRPGLGPSAGARGYRFAVLASLLRDHRRSPAEAERLVDRWRKLLEVRRAQGATPASTAEHVDRFERQRIAAPFPAERGSRDRRRRRRRVV